jgi:hypothetical protein
MAAAPHIISDFRGKAIGVPMAGAGTLYVISTLLAVQMTTPDAARTVDLALDDLWPMAMLLVPTTIVGALLSGIPLLLGVSIMARAGKRNVGLRHPAIWAMAGAAGPGLTLFIDLQGLEPMALALTWTGASCALLARRYVSWDEVDGRPVAARA